MELYPIHATGIHAFCSDMILEPYDLDTVYFMSICGYQATVKGIIANLLENYPAIHKRFGLSCQKTYISR